MANPTGGGLIWRLLVGVAVQAATVSVVALAYRATGTQFEFSHHVIAFVIVAASMGWAQWLAERPVDGLNALARLGQLSAVRAGLPVGVVVLLDYLFVPGFLNSIVVYLLAGYAVGTIASLVMVHRVVAKRDKVGSQSV